MVHREAWLDQCRFHILHSPSRSKATLQRVVGLASGISDMIFSPFQTVLKASSEPSSLPLRLRQHKTKRQMDHTSLNRPPQQPVSFVKAHYHPFLFAMMAFSAMAELGLTAFLVSAGNEHRTWPSPRYHSLLILFIFNAVWTTLFSTAYMMWIVDGASHFLASIASSVIWLLMTCILWGTAAGVMHNTRSGGNCAGRATISRCRQSLTVEALGWTEFGLCVLTMAATCLWVRKSRRSHMSDTHRFV